jgi:hypothetical protein
MVVFVISFVSVISRELPRRCSAELFAHDDGGGAASVGAAIIASAFPDFDETKTFLESER